MDASFNSPVRGSTSRFSDASSHSPLSFGSPTTTPQRRSQRSSPRTTDRYISDRPSQDPTISRFLLASKENTIPPSRRCREESPSSPLPFFPGDTPGRASAGKRTSPANGTTFGTQRSLNSSLDDVDQSGRYTDVDPYSVRLARTLFPDAQTTVLGLHSCVQNTAAPSPTETERFSTSLGVVYGNNRARNFQSKTFRMIASTPERILDAPQLVDDFYLNVIDWSSTNLLAVGLGSAVYMWREDMGSVLLSTSDASHGALATSVRWHQDGTLLAVGKDNGTVQLWDAPTQKLLREIHFHKARVASLSWCDQTLASGSRDNTIGLFDLRDPLSTTALRGHTNEVCGLQWSSNCCDLASGGNDNNVLIWDRRRHSEDGQTPLWTFTDHHAAVKAISWNPVRPHILASGGGTADKTLRFWNVSTGECLQSIDTHSQVCSVLWNRSGTELVSAHGFSDNQLTVWKYPALHRVADLRGHTSRVLHAVMSPDGEVVASAAVDETIRFWRCFLPTPGTLPPPRASERSRNAYCDPIQGGVDSDWTTGDALR